VVECARPGAGCDAFRARRPPPQVAPGPEGTPLSPVCSAPDNPTGDKIAGRYRTILDSLPVLDSCFKARHPRLYSAFPGICRLHGDRSRDSPAGALVLPRAVLAVLLTFGLVSRPVLSFRAAFPLASIGIGIAVFLIWIGPDLLFGYRHYWLFDNAHYRHGCQFRGSRSETKCHVHRVAGGLLGGAGCRFSRNCSGAAG